MCFGNNEGDIEMNNVKKFLDEVNKIYDCGLTKMRIGNECDGGYILDAKLCKNTDTVYSFGIGNDVSFELDFVDMFDNAKAKLFDYTIDSLPIQHSKFEFYKNGVGIGFNHLKTEQSKSLTLKMDIEYDEWGAFQLFNDDVLNKCSQMVVEFHVVHIENYDGLTPYFDEFYNSIYNKLNDELFYGYYKVLKRLNELFFIYHIHPNNSLPKICVNGYVFPPLLELSFVRKDLVNKGSMQPVLQMEYSTIKGLDCPSELGKPDIIDWFPVGSGV